MMKRAQQIWVSAALLLCSAGCIHVNRPPVPPTVDTTAEYPADEFRKDYAAYQAAVKNGTAPDLQSARLLRNQMVNRIEVDIEKHYREFEQSLTSGRSGLEVGSDVVELGLSSAIGVVGATDIKDLLAASLTGFHGTRLSVDKNIFREKTTEILISQMQASRDSVRNRITQKISGIDVSGYPFEEAWRDLVEFFYAGTLPGALQQLQNDAGHAAAAARQEATTIDVNRANTAAEAQAAIRIRSKYAELARMAENPETRDGAIKQLQDILMGLGDTAGARNTAPADLLKALRTQMGAAASDPAKLNLLDKLITPAPR
ncbi:MAG TPA: hypothetical protein VFU76_03805 [Terriglobales bacterium]|nr:hypothetical protein [Terriglobales bacterium]